jgi:guanylate kinase
LDIDIQGVMKVKESSLSPRYLFISPPSIEELEMRLRGRGTETEEAIKKRLGNAAKEMEYGQADGGKNFDRIFVNNNLDITFASMAKEFEEWYPHLNAA